MAVDVVIRACARISSYPVTSGTAYSETNAPTGTERMHEMVDSENIIKLKVEGEEVEIDLSDRDKLTETLQKGLHYDQKMRAVSEREKDLHTMDDWRRWASEHPAQALHVQKIFDGQVDPLATGALAGKPNESDDEPDALDLDDLETRLVHGVTSRLEAEREKQAFKDGNPGADVNKLIEFAVERGFATASLDDVYKFMRLEESIEDAKREGIAEALDHLNSSADLSPLIQRATARRDTGQPKKSQLMMDLEAIQKDQDRPLPSP